LGVEGDIWNEGSDEAYVCQHDSPPAIAPPRGEAPGGLPEAGNKYDTHLTTKCHRGGLTRLSDENRYKQTTACIKKFSPEIPAKFKTNKKLRLYKELEQRLNGTERYTQLRKGQVVVVHMNTFHQVRDVSDRILVKIQCRLGVERQPEEGWIVAADIQKGERFVIKEHLERVPEY